MSLTIKAHDKSNNETRRFRVDESVCTNFEYLKQKILTAFQFPPNTDIRIQWNDGEDFISLSTDEELVDAIGNRQDDMLKLFLSTSPSSVLHPGIFCDGCSQTLTGDRFKCLLCPDYDLCRRCFSSGKHSEHDMIVLRKPDNWPHSLLERFLHRMGNVYERFQHKRDKQQPDDEDCQETDKKEKKEKKACKGKKEKCKEATSSSRSHHHPCGPPPHPFGGHGQPGAPHHPFWPHGPPGPPHHPFWPHGPPGPPHLFGPRGPPPHPTGLPGMSCGPGPHQRPFSEPHQSPPCSQTPPKEPDQPAQSGHVEPQCPASPAGSDVVMLDYDQVQPDSTPNPSAPETTETTSQAVLYPSLPLSTTEDEPKSFVSSEPLPENVVKAITWMKSMGFKDEGGWLTLLLKEKNGDINQVLEVIDMSTKRLPQT